MTDDRIDLTQNDIQGIIQRQLMELNAYLSQGPAHVNRDVCMMYLERAAQFAQRLPSQHMTASDAVKSEARKN